VPQATRANQMKQINIKLTEAQIKHLETVGNRSQYIRSLIDNDTNRPTRREYAESLIIEMVTAEMLHKSELQIISQLAGMLASQMSGKDQLNGIMGRVGK